MLNVRLREREGVIATPPDRRAHTEALLASEQRAERAKILYIAVCVGLLACFLVALVVVRSCHRRRAAAQEEARRLRLVATGSFATPIPVEPNEYHIFLSHAWQTGQDQSRVIKERLLGMMPDLKIFLE